MQSKFDRLVLHGPTPLDTFKLLNHKEKTKIKNLLIARIAINLADFIALAGVGFLSIIFGRIFSTGTTNSIEIPLFGTVLVEQNFALIISVIVAISFISKSILSIAFGYRTGAYLANIEGRFARDLIVDQLSPVHISKSKNDVSELQTFLTRSVSSLASGLLSAGMTLVAEGALLLGMAIIFLIVNPIAAFSLFCYMALVVFFMNKFVGKKLATLAREELIVLEDNFNSVKDLMAVDQEIRTLGVAKLWTSRISEKRKRLADISGETMAVASMPRHILETALIVGLALLIGAMVLVSSLEDQAVTIGVFLAGGLRLVSALMPIQGALGTLRTSSTLAIPAFNILSSESHKDQILSVFGSTANSTKKNLGQRPANVEFCSTTVAVGNKKVLTQINLEIEAGQFVGIIGKSGAGKSSLLKSVLGAISISEGHVLIDGLDSTKIIEAKPGLVGYVPQRSNLIRGTFAQNISLEFDEQKSNEEDLLRAINLSGLQEVVHKLPQGLSTLLHSGQSNLSGGEIQKVGLARALYGNPGLILLDEPTSALDTRSQNEFSALIENLRGDVTILWIAHQTSLLKSADRIIHVKRGSAQFTN